MKPSLEKVAVIETLSIEEAERVLKIIMDTEYETCIEYAGEEGIVISMLRRVNG